MTRKHSLSLASFWWAVGFLMVGPLFGEEYLSPKALVASPDNSKLYVAEYTANQVAAVSIESLKVDKTFALPGPPTGLVVSLDGGTLYVTCGEPEGKVYEVALKTGKVKVFVKVGHTPICPVLSSDGKRMYVCNRFNNNVSIIDVGARKELGRVQVLREPYACALTPDGKSLLVINHLPAGRSDADYVSAAVSVIDTAKARVVKNLELPNGSSSLRDICMSPDGKYAYVTHILAHYALPTTQLERGWMNTNALTVLDASARKVVNTVLLDDVDLGASNPWGVRCTADGKYICVTHAGTHEVSAIDRKALHEKLDKVAAGKRVSDVSQHPEDVPSDLSFLVDIRRRLQLKGNGPRGLVTIGTKIYAAEYFTDSIGIVDVTQMRRGQAVSVALGPKRKRTVVRWGEMLFDDASHCFQKWQSCSSCHPDSRVDALNWDILNDGLGNPKNVKSMLLAHKTPPATSLGVRASAEVSVRAGIRFIQLAVRPEEEAKAIDEYLKSLQPVPSPHLVNGKLSPSARRGKEIFGRVKCSECHEPPLYTDLQKYKLGLGRGMDKGKKFDTPSLVEAWRTAPYLHDGRALTIQEVIKSAHGERIHKKTAPLTEQEKKDLAEFVLSL